MNVVQQDCWVIGGTMDGFWFGLKSHLLYVVCDYNIMV